MAAFDLFKSFGDKLLESSTPNDVVDQIMLQLLLKAFQDKKFVCEEAERTLNTMLCPQHQSLCFASSKCMLSMQI
ncbi:hypothetical protein HanOQP8_Chr12g0462801 [Helianthus annuus]|nr:hypothetical protein HanLR1_Chr12g0463571 [Helianthus annuus]KAJ0679717.1 hypothetical protein HanOQP8_Chr12g0462801 [Helianthus annuus]